MSDDFLYGDIEEKGRDLEIHNLIKKCQKLERENENLKEELSDSKAQIIFLSEQKEVVERNMMSLFNTATADMKRKDKQIIDLTMRLKQK